MKSLSLYRIGLPPGEELTVTALHHGLWVASGSIQADRQDLSANAAMYLSGQIKLLSTSRKLATALQFALEEAETDLGVTSHRTKLLSNSVPINQDDCLMRLDKVTFPGGACAYRHVHPGPGIRYLSCGRLEICSDNHTEVMQAGHAWFEGANSPVRANNLDGGTSEFVRVLLLPKAYEGKPTLKILSDEDRAKPRLQVNHRYFDQALTF